MPDSPTLSPPLLPAPTMAGEEAAVFQAVGTTYNDDGLVEVL